MIVDGVILIEGRVDFLHNLGNFLKTNVSPVVLTTDEVQYLGDSVGDYFPDILSCRQSGLWIANLVNFFFNHVQGNVEATTQGGDHLVDVGAVVDMFYQDSDVVGHVDKGPVGFGSEALVVLCGQDPILLSVTHFMPMSLEVVHEDSVDGSLETPLTLSIPGHDLDPTITPL